MLPVLPARSTDGPSMVCRMIFDELCVLANGDIVCSCGDPAGLRVYGNVRRDRIAEVFDGPLYREMRAWQLAAPPGSFCPVIGNRCGGRVSRASRADGPEGRRVRVLQLEPISACNVACPGCPATKLKGRDPAYAPDRLNRLPLPVMLDVVDQLPHLEKLLFYNFGEPFLHRDAIAFLREVRRRRPDVIVHTSTNGLALTPEVIEALAAEALVDRIVFSIDGARERSYRRYRAGGSLVAALGALERLLAALDRHGTRGRVEPIWQYILFRWNDSRRELLEARARAAALGVSLKWVVTHTPGASRTYRDGTPALRRLFEGGDTFEALTCDARMAHLWKHGGAVEGRYLAHLELDRQTLRAPAGGRAPALLRVTNLGSSSWPEPAAAVTVGTRLRNVGGHACGEGRRIPVPAGARVPGGTGSVLLDVAAPATPGSYQVTVDLVEEGVCWFSERGSEPASILLEVSDADGPPAWGALVNGVSRRPGAGAGSRGPGILEP